MDVQAIKPFLLNWLIATQVDVTRYVMFEVGV